MYYLPLVPCKLEITALILPANNHSQW